MGLATGAGVARRAIGRQARQLGQAGRQVAHEDLRRAAGAQGEPDVNATSVPSTLIVGEDPLA